MRQNEKSSDISRTAEPPIDSWNGSRESEEDSYRSYELDATYLSPDIQQSGAATEDAFQELEREQQENIIVWLRDEGASVRQIVSHTGFTTKQVRNLTDKDKKKQAD